MLSRLTKAQFLSANDLKQKEVELDDGSVLVQGLGASFSNKAQSEALVVKQIGREQISRVDTALMEEIQLLHGLLEPKLDSIEEARQFMENNGPSARKIIEAIDELSGVDKEAISDAEARFPSGRTGAEQRGPVGADEAPSGGG